MDYMDYIMDYEDDDYFVRDDDYFLDEMIYPRYAIDGFSCECDEDCYYNYDEFGGDLGDSYC